MLWLLQCYPDDARTQIKAAQKATVSPSGGAGSSEPSGGAGSSEPSGGAGSSDTRVAASEMQRRDERSPAPASVYSCDYITKDICTSYQNSHSFYEPHSFMGGFRMYNEWING